MKCPACAATLKETQAGDVKVDLCSDGCGGVWFDAVEIKKFDEEHEIDANIILSVNKKSDQKLIPAPRQCPRCTTDVLVRQSYDPRNQVEIDLCWTCGGVWLDTGELATIRSQFKTEAERVKASDVFVDAAINSHIKAMHDELKLQQMQDRAEYSNRAKSLLTGIKKLFYP